MATARHTDLWGYVQKQVWPSGNVRVLPSALTVHVPIEDEWHGEAFHSRADDLLGSWEQALAAGHDRRAARLRAAWLHQVHLDRLTYAKATARERSLRLDPIGRGPLVDQPTVHYRDRLPWYLTPVSRYMDRRLPDRATDVVDLWNGAGGVFDGLYIADEPITSTQYPVHSLIGAISADGHASDWFVLDRWAS